MGEGESAWEEHIEGKGRMTPAAGVALQSSVMHKSYRRSSQEPNEPNSQFLLLFKLL